MAADDVAPTRMEAAKAAARDDRRAAAAGRRDRRRRVQRRRAGRPGADHDQAAVLAAIDRLAPSRGTSLGQGSSRRSRRSSRPRPTRRRLLQQPLAEPTETPAPVAARQPRGAAIVLFSDGENNERPDPLDAAAGRGRPRASGSSPSASGRPPGRPSTSTGSGSRRGSTRTPSRQIADLTGGHLRAGADARPAAVYDQLAAQPRRARRGAGAHRARRGARARCCSARRRPVPRSLGRLP